MLGSWIEEEMQTVDLHDKRLNERLEQLLSQLSNRPTASIPAACGGRNEMVAAYRFFDNDQATFDKILKPHVDSSLRRIVTQPVVILSSDSSEIDVTRPDQVVAGAGPLDGGSRLGALLHMIEAFTPDGTPLGAVGAKSWVRSAIQQGATSRTRTESIAKPIKEKESYRWVEMFDRTKEVAGQSPATQCVCVADSESDIYEVLTAAQTKPQNLNWIVRGCRDRVLHQKKAKSSDATVHLREHVLQKKVLFTNTIKVRGRTPKLAIETRSRKQARQSRTAEVAVRVASVTLRPPYRVDRKLLPVTVNVVLVREENPPHDEVPIEWLLLTDLSIDNEEQIRQVIQYYSVRWMIEVFFRVLKTGCRVEQRRFEQIDRMLCCLAVYMIVAWRTLYVCRLGRSCPDVSCEAVFEPAEWQAIWMVVKKTKLPKQPPKLLAMIKIVARLGGYVERPKSLPGPQTIWIGLQRTHDITNCWHTFGPGKQQRK